MRGGEERRERGELRGQRGEGEGESQSGCAGAQGEGAILASGPQKENKQARESYGGLRFQVRLCDSGKAVNLKPETVRKLNQAPWLLWRLDRLPHKGSHLLGPSLRFLNFPMYPCAAAVPGSRMEKLLAHMPVF